MEVFYFIHVKLHQVKYYNWKTFTWQLAWLALFKQAFVTNFSMPNLGSYSTVVNNELWGEARILHKNLWQNALQQWWFLVFNYCCKAPHLSCLQGAWLSLYLYFGFSWHFWKPKCLNFSKFWDYHFCPFWGYHLKWDFTWRKIASKEKRNCISQKKCTNYNAIDKVNQVTKYNL